MHITKKITTTITIQRKHQLPFSMGIIAHFKYYYTITRTKGEYSNTHSYFEGHIVLDRVK